MVDNNLYEQQDLTVESGGTATCNPNHDDDGASGDWGGDWYTLLANGTSSIDGSTQNGKLDGAITQLGDSVYATYTDNWLSQKNYFHTYEPRSTYPYPTDPKSFHQFLLEHLLK